MTTVDLTQGPLTIPQIVPVPGPSAYQVAVANGFVGTEAEWLISLKGSTGPAGMGASVPGGRLTLVSGAPEMPQTADYTSTVLYYAPFESDKIPLFDGTNWGSYSFASGPFDTVGLSMSGGAAWTANSKRDVFVTLVDGVPTLCTGPAWPGDSTAARGLVRRNGLWVNAASMTCDVGIVVAANRATWVGSINIGAAAGTLQALFTPGQNRRCDVWNLYHQREIALGVGCPPASASLPVVWKPDTQYPTYKAFNNDINNSGYYFTGLPQNVECEYHQLGFLNTYGFNAGALIITVCKNSLSNPTSWGQASSDQESPATGYFQGVVQTRSLFRDRGVVGSHRAIMGVAGANNFNGVTIYGLDPRSNWGALDRSHSMWIRYQG